MTDLAKLGLVPGQKHPDALLLDLIAVERRQAARLGDRFSLRDGLEHQKLVELIARLRAVTLSALCEKARHALDGWETSGGPEGEIFDLQSSVILEMLNVLTLFTDKEVATRRKRA